MCGIVGIFGYGPVNQALYDALLVLQHRGQDAAGIVTLEGRKLHLRKDNGLARDVFRTRHMIDLRGNMGIGHVRYPTAGCSSSAEAQPFYVNSPFGITLAHNGSLTNAEELKEDLYRADRRHINTSSDSEILLNVLAHELQAQGKFHITEHDVFSAVVAVHKRCRGGYAAVAMINGYGVLAFRDPHGIRPVCFGRRETPRGVEYMVASESVALDAQEFERMRDLAPGEALFIDMQGRLHTYQCATAASHTPCIFEFVYFARPDSIIDNIFVHKARSRMGSRLARKIRRVWPDHDIDVVIPIPDTSRTAALALANSLEVKYAEGFIKNRYIGRTFIMPGQQVRKKSVKQKLNPIDSEFKDKNVLLVDDSIVRGTTSRQIVQMAREAGASKVYFASAAPPVRHPNVYGIDMPAASELVAHGRSEREVQEWIGADRLIFQDLHDLIDAVVKRDKSDVTAFDTSVFDGHYVTGDVNNKYLEQLELLRCDTAKQERDSTDSTLVGIHNNT
ncbi:MAG: amidophosphoribosyltransferase [Candidatus Sedimenticola endophacoides]|uniref:Amidophosphoribosyltransferase n=2 Tax=Candidatus Sedimenticola endophacoides TaxID=2548426 RepID=A0A657PT81_9GAMM|nr:MAG: amidophosphoribosyltransferase [Candidatus Sedimenticola endophacoides]OQX34780.1 MAG: amidophosphoribosyltransferase [Candidatus Sedimenticola endophacoides]OQX41778.1 MAG: amidophosphoribosyltransferase [Candidatus Sedimenticola endophacoides]OQX43479.1 MAG: amidophosphoribosyltransferase [Candidatus Sedimenticola endophacoides]OQX46105.1 MAG: amidophosphoribosyltransferase [Candidatus Sedimenticola endophacoides]